MTYVSIRLGIRSCPLGEDGEQTASVRGSGIQRHPVPLCALHLGGAAQ